MLHDFMSFFLKCRLRMNEIPLLPTELCIDWSSKSPQIKNIYLCEKSNHKPTHDIYDNPHLKNYCRENEAKPKMLNDISKHRLDQLLGHITCYQHTKHCWSDKVTH
ncbi:hypothetical protein V8G54_022536 [Vigna mungo]|uniref:Uncharacterized protein n=1 Tax=Vigna mungo TaxID=3915 RepID=A0AAQ3N3A6_VIGMU